MPWTLPEGDEGQCVKVGMRVEPEHILGASRRRSRFGDARDSAQRQRVVAAHEDRHRARHRRLGDLGQRPGPGDVFGQRKDLGRIFGNRLQGGGCDIADVGDIVAQVREFVGQPGHAVGLGAHDTAAAALAAVHGHTNKFDPGHFLLLSRHSITAFCQRIESAKWSVCHQENQVERIFRGSGRKRARAGLGAAPRPNGAGATAGEITPLPGTRRGNLGG